MPTTPSLDMNPASTILAWLAPLVGLQGFPHLIEGERKKGWTRFGIGLGLILGPIAWFTFGDPLLFAFANPLGYFATLLTILGTYLFLWGEGIVYAHRRERLDGLAPVEPNQ